MRSLRKRGVVWALAGVLYLLVAAAVTFAQRPAVRDPQVVPAKSELVIRAVDSRENIAPPSLRPAPRSTANQSPLFSQGDEQAAAKSRGCVTCHENTGDMHQSKTVRLGCADCHGGDPVATTKNQAHVAPCFPQAWPTSANPVRSHALLNHESPEFIRFVNPGDLRVAQVTCGNCHADAVLGVQKSMMTHGCMLWGAALYNNGAVPKKWAHYGESYSSTGVPQRMQTVPPPTPDQIARKGILPYLDPLPRFEITQPGNILRTFERGGRFRPEVGIPERLEESGRPRSRLSTRGLGTENRTDPVFIGLQKTRLLDPTLNFLGTNDHPGDYRSSGCTACHVVYANDRNPVHSGSYYARFGNRGLARSGPDTDPTIPKDEPGHPIEHKFSLSIPTSQCIVCHIHPGTNVLNSYLGYMWWDEETDGQLIYPPRQKYPTAEEFTQSQLQNPNESAARNRLSDPEFLANLSDLNTQTEHTQFADFHGHGWAFRAVFKRDRAGNMLDYQGNAVADVSNEKLRAAVRPPSPEERRCGKQREGTPVHLMDIHLEKGMHCVDCHFYQDNHGNSKLYGEVRAAIEIGCTDCHGTIAERARLRTTGPAAPENGSARTSGTDLRALRTPFGKRRFEERGRTIVQNSMVEPDVSWEVVQTADTIDPASAHYNVRSHVAKTVRHGADGKLDWGGKFSTDQCAHKDEAMSCIACHSSWNPSCFGCHLPQKANKKLPSLHFEGDVSRNLVSYNFQTLRDDVYMLAHDGDVTKRRIGPARSSCAVHVGSYNQNRESIYVQQQTISAEGQSGIAFSSNVPHTVRGGVHAGYLPDNDVTHRAGTSETKSCSDCHISKDNDNNAIMAQLLMQGTNYVNFIGRYCWVAAGEHGFAGVVVTERDEPQAVIGSSLHQLAFPDFYRKHVEHDGMLEHAHEHPGKDIGEGLLHPLRKPEILAVQARGEYLYAACGLGGLRVFDIAFIDHKGFSERITTAPVSPVGQRFFVETKYATAVAAPTTIAPDPTRTHLPENREQKIHPLYGYIYVADREEGLILVGAGTLLDGNPLNNFLERAVTFNPNGLLKGARGITIVGTYAYICCDAGLVIVGLDDPKNPKVVNVLGPEMLREPRSVQVQFRYAFVCDAGGVSVLEVTALDKPKVVARLGLEDARNIYLARNYAYVAAGEQGLVILDITNPEQPQVDQVFTADGCLNDAHDVKLGITYTSEFAYVADGCNGLRLVQLTSPEMPTNPGFSPRPMPRLVATYKLPKGGEALAVSKGIDRDRAVDESGNQIAVFGRVGAGPLSRAEQQRMYLRPDGTVWKVSDDPFDTDVFQGPSAPVARPSHASRGATLRR